LSRTTDSGTGTESAARGDDPEHVANAVRIAADRGTSPPQLKRLLRGDLERIVQRALEKNPDARYASVTALINDLSAYLEGNALPGGNRRYRIAKFLRKHRLPVAIASALTAIILASGVAIAISVQAALREAKTTAAVKDFLLSVFSASDPRQTQGKDPTVHDVLDRGAQRIEKDLNDQPEVRAELQSALGGIYLRLGAYPQAEALQEPAAKALLAFDSKPLLTALTLREWGESLLNQGKIDAAKSRLDQAIERYRVLPDPPVREFDRAIYIRAFVGITGHDYKDALQVTEEEVRLARKHPELPELLGAALSARGAAHWGLHDYKSAEPELLESLTALRAAYGDESIKLCSALQTLSIIYGDTERYVAALAVSEQALSAARHNMAERHPYVARLLFDTGQAHRRLGHYSEAQVRLEQALAVQRDLLGADHEESRASLAELGLILAELGQYDRGERALTEAQAMRRKVYQPDDDEVLNAQSDLAYVHLLQMQLDVAEQELREILKVKKALGRPTPPITRARLGEVRRLRGDLPEALSLERSALDSATQQTEGEQSSEAATVRYYLGLALAATGDHDSAVLTLRQALQYFVRLVPEDTHPQAATIRLALGQLLAQRSETRTEALDILQRSVTARRTAFGGDHAFTRAAEQALADAGALDRAVNEK
jgi:eukaryotic-like serine/threonine-protein kinase